MSAVVVRHMAMGKKHYKTALFFVIFLLLSSVCVSCQTLYRLLFTRSYVDLDYNFSLKEKTGEISSGTVQFFGEKEKISGKNDIIISKFHDYFSEEKDCCADRVFSCYGFKYSFKIYFGFENYRTKKFGEEEKGKIFNIRIEGMPGKYKFDRINPVMEKTSTIIAFGGVDVGNSEEETLDDVYIKQDLLPVCITHFKVGKQRYSIVIKEFGQENSELSLRDIIRNERQTFYVSDDNGNVFMSFSQQEHKTYTCGQKVEEELLPAVGVYCCVFNLLNSH